MQRTRRRRPRHRLINHLARSVPGQGPKLARIRHHVHFFASRQQSSYAPSVPHACVLAGLCSRIFFSKQTHTTQGNATTLLDGTWMEMLLDLPRKRDDEVFFSGKSNHRSDYSTARVTRFLVRRIRAMRACDLRLTENLVCRPHLSETTHGTPTLVSYA
jgi:hypothetical protein